MDDDVERRALEGLSRRARGSRFVDRMPETERASYSLDMGEYSKREPWMDLVERDPAQTRKPWIEGLEKYPPDDEER